jgi:membrane-associated phospholipid phosphatase
MSLRLPLTAALCLLSLVDARAQSGLLDRRSAHFWSHEGNAGFLVLGVAAPLLDGRGDGGRRSLRTLEALAATTIVDSALKGIVREKRPDTDERNSFPSGHAAAAFAIAFARANDARNRQPLWLLGAFLIADSRVTLHRHYPHDVIAGAALGASGLRLHLFRNL